MTVMLTFSSELSGYDPLKNQVLNAARAKNLELSYSVIRYPDDNTTEHVISLAPDIIIVYDYLPYKSCENLYKTIMTGLDKDVYFVFYMPRARIEHERAFFSNISCSTFYINQEKAQLIDKVSELLGVELPRGKPVK